MNTKPDDIFEDILRHLRPALLGLLFAVFTLLFGFGLGIVFGLNEGIIKTRLKTSAAEVRDSVYHGDDAAIKAVLDKSWVYFQRAHLHAGGLGATAVGLILVVVVLGTGPLLTRIISLGLGAGGLGIRSSGCGLVCARPGSAAQRRPRNRSSGSPCRPPAPSWLPPSRSPSWSSPRSFHGAFQILRNETVSVALSGTPALTGY